MRRNQRGFTLMELMVVIVIVAILAAVAVPLYINYVKDARRTEAKAAIGALATAMEEYYLKEGEYAPDLATLNPENNADRKTNLSNDTVLEIQDHWDITVAGRGDAGYSLTLNGNESGYTKVGVIYDYTRGEGPTITDTDGGGGGGGGGGGDGNEG